MISGFSEYQSGVDLDYHTINPANLCIIRSQEETQALGLAPFKPESSRLNRSNNWMRLGRDAIMLVSQAWLPWI